MDGARQPELLHTIRVTQPLANLNRLYYRASSLMAGREVATVSWFLLSVAELILAFLWILSQAFRWRPVERTVFPERLPEDSNLPPIDIFVCTADPEKEPTMEVMNTLISSMCLDYPPEKLHVYLSDDGGSQLTLCATKLAYRFAKAWIPFCRRFELETRCPEVYFSSFERSCCGGGNEELLKEEKTIQEKKLLRMFNADVWVAHVARDTGHMGCSIAPDTGWGGPSHCGLCGGLDETADHMFLTCSVSEGLWTFFRSSLGVWGRLVSIAQAWTTWRAVGVARGTRRAWDMVSL